MLSSLLLATIVSLASATCNKRSTIACNNSPDLCDKSYGEITHLGAHDSPFYALDSSANSAATQHYNSTDQLSAGVRLLSGQVHDSDGEWHLCHTSCDLYDAGTLTDWLSGIKGWMDDNPNDGMDSLNQFQI